MEFGDRRRSRGPVVTLATSGGYLVIPDTALEGVPEPADLQGVLVWPGSFILICIAMGFVCNRLEGSSWLKAATSATIVFLAILSLYRLVWFSPFDDANLNALWNFSLLPIGSGLLVYSLLMVLRTWLTSGKTKQERGT
jgi:hypothetical protein